MKSLRSILFAAILLLVIVAACAPQASSQNADFRGLPNANAGAASPSAAAPTADTSAAQVLKTLTVAHPPMQVGSIDRYFDGALLDAVPNDGPFMMGSGAPGSPQIQVTVSNFWIYGTEVSNQMYAQCVSLGKCSRPNATDNPNFNNPRFVNYPAVGVTWQQAADYCSYAHGRLPTEAEWEKAASWDPVQKLKRVYPWGDHNPTCDLLNFKYCLNRATSVTSYGQGASPYGAYNMEGNVFEWVGDWFQPDYAKNAASTDPAGPQTGTARVIRSSAYDSDAIDASPSARFSAAPTAHRPNLGFRCVVQDPSYFAPYCEMPVFYGLDPSTNGVSGKPCPDPVITHAEACNPDNTSVDFVTVQNTGPTTVNISGLQACDPPNNDAGVTHTCKPGLTIQVSASCNVTPGGNPACPPNFKQDPNNPLRCLAIGATGACPAGFQYDPKLQCCSAAADQPALVPLCAVGQHLFEGVCVNDYGGPVQPASITYTTGGLDCAILNTGGSGIVPFTTSTPPPPQPTATSVVPFPTSTPHPGGCDLKPKDCPFGVDRHTCTCKLLP